MASNDQSGEVIKYASASKEVKQPIKHLGNRVSGGIILLIAFGILWIYGFSGEIRLVTNSATTAKNPTASAQAQSILGKLYITSTIFVVIGFGLLLSYFKKSTNAAFFTSIFTVSFTILISPIFQKFWFNVFITNFKGGPTFTDTSPDRFINYSLSGMYIYLDFYNLKIALANSIAQLVVALSLYGKMSISQVIFNSFGFNFVWNLNYFLCALIQFNSPDTRIYDDYQISNIYLFGACYGLVLSFIIKGTQTQANVYFSGSHNSSVLSLLGTFFLFLSFCVTTTLFSTKQAILGTTEFVRGYIWQEAFISTYIALSASVIFTYAFSILFNSDGKIGIRGSIIGTLTGAIIYGPVAGTCINIGAAIASGLFAGILAALFFEKIYPKVNRQTTKDSFGSIGILIVSFFGTFFISPIVLITYNIYKVNLPTLWTSTNFNATISSLNYAGYVLIYVGVSMGIGLIGGAIIGLLLRLFNNAVHHYKDSQFFNTGSISHGLRQSRNQQPIIQQYPIGSGQQLDNNRDY